MKWNKKKAFLWDGTVRVDDFQPPARPVQSRKSILFFLLSVVSARVNEPCGLIIPGRSSYSHGGGVILLFFFFFPFGFLVVLMLLFFDLGDGEGSRIEERWKWWNGRRQKAGGCRSINREKTLTSRLVLLGSVCVWIAVWVITCAPRRRRFNFCGFHDEKKKKKKRSESLRPNRFWDVGLISIYISFSFRVSTDGTTKAHWSVCSLPRFFFPIFHHRTIVSYVVHRERESVAKRGCILETWRCEQEKEEERNVWPTSFCKKENTSFTINQLAHLVDSTTYFLVSIWLLHLPSWIFENFDLFIFSFLLFCVDVLLLLHT